MSSARLLVLTSQAGTQMSTKVRNYCHRIMKLQRLDIKKKKKEVVFNFNGCRCEGRTSASVAWSHAMKNSHRQWNVCFIYVLTEWPALSHSLLITPALPVLTQKAGGGSLARGDRWCHNSVWAQPRWPVCERLGRRRGPCEAGMQGYIAVRSWELWDVCTEGRQDVKRR